MAKNLALEIAIKAKNLASTAFDKVKQSLENTSSTADKTEKSLDDLSKTLDGIGENSAAIDEFKQLNTEIENSEKTTKELKAELAEYEKQAAESGNDTAEFKQEITHLKTEIEKVEAAIKGKRVELDKTVKSLKNADVNTDELKRAEKELAAEAKDVRQQIAAKNKALGEQTRALTGANGGIASLTKTVVGLGAAYVGLDKVRDSLVGILGAGDKAQAFASQMTALMGSIEKGDQATKWITDFANNTGTRLENAREAFTSLKTFGLDPMNGSMQSLVDYNAKLGGSQEKLNGIILAAGQAWAKQKLQGEEILQMVERGVPVWDLLAKVTGKNTVELQKMSESGELGRETMQKLFDEMGKQAEGQAAKSLDRLSGQIALISNKWEGFKVKMADAGVYKVAIDFMKQLNQTFDSLVKDGTIDRAAKKVSDFFSGMVANGGQGIKALLDNINAFLTGAERIVAGFKFVFNSFTAGLKGIAQASTLLISEVLAGWAKVFEFMGADTLAQKAQQQSKALLAVSNAFKTELEKDIQDVHTAWETITQSSNETVTKNYQQTAEQLKKTTEAQKQSIETVDETAKKSVEDLSLVMSKAGIVTTKSLQDTEAKAKETYEQINKAHKNGEVGVYELEQAYKKWEEAANATAKATKGIVDPALKAARANLNLKDSNEQGADSASANAKEIARLREELRLLQLQLQQTNGGLQQQLDIQTQLNNQRRQYSAENSRNNLTESRTLTTTSGESVDIEKLSARELSDLRAQYNKSASTTKFAHMRDHYAKQIAIVDEQYNKVTDAARKQRTNSNSNNSSSASSSNNQSSNANSNNSARVVGADSSTITDNTRALRQLTESLDLLRFSMEGQSDFISELERIKSTS
ncbi:phage tape measure protein [Catenovulum agarivorans DS-2]|uniref:Phage tape measure protein n=1 Tax=Catenovulum agarivorans DS-2 TaxID=1328313 RepID=W7QLP5_9ALTE|nr:tape measure protein [Catenovulum agarivorans]EWH09862.1 phage tape measure protein [Catenovulum agarivorans DS-2]